MEITIRGETTKFKTDLDAFLFLMQDQFIYGGKKYGLSAEKESTDVLFDRYGHNWLIGTMDKYTFRFKNLARERDLLKIATYCYILWLKRGFFLKERGLIDVIDTSVKLKTEFFEKFKNQFTNYRIQDDLNREKPVGIFQREPMVEVSDLLAKMGNSDWVDIKKEDIFDTVIRVYLTWHKNYKNAERRDTDTYNESDQK